MHLFGKIKFTLKYFFLINGKQIHPQKQGVHYMLWGINSHDRILHLND